MNIEARGDLAQLKQSVNASIGSLEVTMNALTEVMNALREGNFDKRVDAKVEGAFKVAVDQAMQAMQSMLADIGNVMGRVAQGDISQRIQAEGRGDFAKLKDDINLSLDALSSLNDIAVVASALSKGDLTETINKHYPGIFGTVIVGMNAG